MIVGALNGMSSVLSVSVSVSVPVLFETEIESEELIVEEGEGNMSDGSGTVQYSSR